MHRGVLIHCLPWLAVIVGSAIALRWLIVLSGARLRFGRLRMLHAHQAGSVQSLSFVLTLPVFIMFMMLIVQATQLMIGQVVVEYAAIAAARAAMVWVPAPSPDGTIPSVTIIPGQALPSPWPLAQEAENCISSISPAASQSNSQGGTRYQVSPGSPKYQKILSAAVLACLPIAPSRSVAQAGGQGAQNSPVAQAAPVLTAAYMAVSPQSANNPKIGQRLANKLVYSLNNTQMQLTFVHKNVEPPLTTWMVPADVGEFYANEVGWQDELQVTIWHRLALLPGPGRLLFSQAASPSGAPDLVSSQIQQQSSDLYTYTLSASASLGNEGDKWVLSYVKHN